MISTLATEKIIYQCSAVDITKGGGLETYIVSLINSQMPGIKNAHLPALKYLKRDNCVLLHLHDPECLGELTGELPAIFTLHNHCSYCPSGTKYLAAQQKPCDRTMHPLGCTWGHLVDKCGCRRPEVLTQKLWNTHQFLANLKKLHIPVIANSNFIREQIISNGLSPERITTLHCGVQQPKSPPSKLSAEIHQNQRILFVGRIVPDKGLEWLIKALAQTDSSIHLDIAGEGWDRPRLEQLSAHMGLSDRITWHGWCQGEKLESLYHNCFAVVFPSLWPEPAGLVTLEAYARYRPVIASAVGGIPEHIQDGQTGILIPPLKIEQLAQAINQLAHNYEQTRWMGEQGQALYAQEFTLDIHIQRLKTIYDKTIAEFRY
jgi:glycosyltransferase involved in cell wall biosynthesis